MSIENLGKSFISTYLNWVRHNASQIPQSDRGIFPSYWFYPYQVIIYKNTIDDIAILLKRKVSGKEDRLTIRNCVCRIEEAILPNLNYTSWALFNLGNGDAHDILLKGGTFSVSDHPLFIIGVGSEVRLMNMRIEAIVQGYPLEIEFAWVLTFPNKKYLKKERAEKEAESDFWDSLASPLMEDMANLFNKNLGIQTVKLYLQYLAKLRDELNRLITRQDIVEQQLQDFLEKHFFLLFEAKPIVKKSRGIGDYLTDFTLDLNDGSKLLVELQLNNDPIIFNDKPSVGFNEAISQVTDWIRWIRNNDKLNINKYSGLIIIGRKSDYEKNKKHVDEILSKLGFDIKLKTYDDLNKTIDTIGAILTKNASIN
jgi:hypothetical protein